MVVIQFVKTHRTFKQLFKDSPCYCAYRFIQNFGFAHTKILYSKLRNFDYSETILKSLQHLAMSWTETCEQQLCALCSGGWYGWAYPKLAVEGRRRRSLHLRDGREQLVDAGADLPDQVLNLVLGVENLDRLGVGVVVDHERPLDRCRVASVAESRRLNIGY